MASPMLLRLSLSRLVFCFPAPLRLLSSVARRSPLAAFSSGGYAGGARRHPLANNEELRRLESAANFAPLSLSAQREYLDALLG